MLKHVEAIDPNSCWNKATPNEFVFVLLGKDIAAADTVDFWIKRRIELGKNQPNDKQITDAEFWAWNVRHK